MSGPPPSPDKVGRHTTTKAVIGVEVLPAAVDGEMPAPPADLPDHLAEEWAELWSGPVRDFVAASDMPALARLFELKALHARYAETLDEGYEGVPWGLALGSQGQLVKHPALESMLAIEKSIVALEDRFGLSTKARQAMGIRMGQLAAADREVQRRQEEKQQRADPRVADPGSAASQPRRAGKRMDGGRASPRRG